MATKKFSPAQIAAQKLFAERARAGTLNQRKKRKPNPGLYDNINAKRARIAAGSDERMRKPGSKGAPTQQAFEQSAMTAKQNPVKNDDIPLGNKMLGDIKSYGNKLHVATIYQYYSTGVPGEQKQYQFIDSRNFSTQGGAMRYLKRYSEKYIKNPDKSKPRAYVMRASQATGRPPVKGTKAGNRLITRRKKALSAPAGYFPNPKAAAMMTGYQVICMHPKKHVVGIFKTMAEAKMVATAMANAKGVAYAVKTVKVHKAHFAV